MNPVSAKYRILKSTLTDTPEEFTIGPCFLFTLVGLNASQIVTQVCDSELAKQFQWQAGQCIKEAAPVAKNRIFASVGESLLARIQLSSVEQCNDTMPAVTSKEAAIGTCCVFLVDSRQDVVEQLMDAEKRFGELEFQSMKARIKTVRGLHIACIRHVSNGKFQPWPSNDDPFEESDDPYVAFSNRLRNSSRSKHVEHQVDFSNPEGLCAVIMALAEEMNASNEQYVSADYSSLGNSVKTTCCVVQ